MLDLGVLASFEAQEEIAGVFGIDAEVVHGSLGIGFGVCCQPSFCESKSVKPSTCGRDECGCLPVSALLRF